MEVETAGEVGAIDDGAVEDEEELAGEFVEGDALVGIHERHLRVRDYRAGGVLQSDQEPEPESGSGVWSNRRFFR